MNEQKASRADENAATGLAPKALLTFMVVLAGLVAACFFWLPANDSNSGQIDKPVANDRSANPSEAHHGKSTLQIKSERVGSLVLSNQGMVDDDQNAWPTEVLTQKVEKTLKSVHKLIANARPIQEGDVATFVSSDFNCGPLIPPDLSVAFEDAALTAWRSGKNTSEPRTPNQAAAGLAAALQDIWAPYSSITDVSCKFKTVGISTAPNGVRTRHLFSCSATTAQGLVEQHATWSIRWTADASRMTSIDVSGFERVLARKVKRTILQDCTKSILSKTPCYGPQLLRGYNYWLRRMEWPRYMYNLGTPAIAVADVNGDGLDDLFLSQENGLPNRLFIQQNDGTAREVSAEWGVDWLEDSRGALLIDLDNDGDQDLVVAVIGGVVVAENQEQRRFVIREVLPTSEDTMSLAAVDYDKDGRLDLYVCAYNPTMSGKMEGRGGIAATGDRFVYHDAKNGGENHLFRNVKTGADAWDFQDVTKRSGLDANNARYSFAASWEDYDNDLDLDLYVANDFGRDNLYRNDGGTFVDVAEEVGAEDSGSGMGITWGDYNRDGWMDAYVSNMFSSAGRRIATQPQFMAEAPEIVRKRLARFARGNTLLKNTGGKTLVDRASMEGVEIGRWAWSSIFCDLNNDGWEDLLVANGFITTEDTGDL